MTEPPEDHLKALWKGQETETTPMSVDAIHERVAVFQRRTRRRFLLTIGLCVLAGASYVGSFIWLSPNEVVRLGWGICLIGIGWMAFRSRDRWPVAQLPEESSAVALVSFHRAQLIRQKLRAGSFLVTAGPLLLGVAVAFVGLGIQAGDAWIARLAPIGMLFGIWLVAFLFIVHRQVRRWRRELDEVDATPRG